MGFNSLIYLIFLAVTAVVYYVLPGRFRWVLLLIASVGYYLSFIPIFLSLLVVVVVINFFMAQWLSKVAVGRTRRMMILIVFLNILILAFFKYFNFFFPGNHIHLYNVDWFFRTDPINKMILPLGLSYLIFTVLSYQIEVKRKTIPAEKHLGYFSLYLLFFPRIAQGPIERPQNLIPQLRQTHFLDYDMVVEGMKLMLWGYFKKLVVADRLAIYVNAVYNNSDQHNGTTLLIATVFFAFQIYADFSGYTDIALGSAKIFGFNLTNNFKRPYFATSITEFWNRWHITFSTWLRDYIFLPLAFFLSDRMKKQKYLFIKTEKWIYLFAIMVTFAICGLWHGEGWTYILWGLLFGVYLTWSNWTEKLNKKIRKQLHVKKTTPIYVFYKVILTFILVSFTWIFFRASSLHEAFVIIKTIFTNFGAMSMNGLGTFIFSLMGIFVLLINDFFCEYIPKIKFLHNNNEIIRFITILFLILFIVSFGVFDGSQFIYFKF